MANVDFNHLECEGLPSLFTTLSRLGKPNLAHESHGNLAILKSEGKPSHSKARGMTLIELLVVVTILLVAAAVFVPRLQPLMDHSKVRESARVIQLFLSTARNQAMASGRSCGVMIEPLPNDTGCAMQLSLVEIPPPYAGDVMGSTATVTRLQNQTALVTLSSPSIIAIHNGDLIQVGLQGYWMTVITQNNAVIPAGTTTFTAGINFSNGETPFWFLQPVGVPGPALPYKILRWPTKSAAAPLQLPAATCIDLTWSGFDPAIAGGPATWPVQTPLPTGPALPTPIVIMFSADGRLDWVSHWDPNPNSPSFTGQPAVTPAYLLVGMRKKVFDSPTDPNIANTNLNDFNSLWVSIDAATGLILISDPAAIGTTNTVLLTPQMGGGPPPDSRYFARRALANGGGK